MKKRKQQLEERTKKDPNRMKNIQSTVDDQGGMMNTALTNIVVIIGFAAFAMTVKYVVNSLVN